MIILKCEITVNNEHVSVPCRNKHRTRVRPLTEQTTLVRQLAETTNTSNKHEQSENKKQRTKNKEHEQSDEQQTNEHLNNYD
jgi:hypothetical protein